MILPVFDATEKQVSPFPVGDVNAPSGQVAPPLCVARDPFQQLEGKRPDRVAAHRQDIDRVDAQANLQRGPVVRTSSPVFGITVTLSSTHLEPDPRVFCTKLHLICRITPISAFLLACGAVTVPAILISR